MVSHDQNRHQYVPVLLTRRGERIALRGTDPQIKARITPLFVVAPVAWDYDSERPAKSTAEHIAPLAGQLVSDWGQGDAFIDTAHLPDTSISGQHPLEIICAAAALAGLTLVPVTGLTRDPSHHAATARLAAGAAGPGAGLRLTHHEALIEASSPHAVAALLSTLSLTPADVDLIIDFEDNVEQPSATNVAVRALMSSFPAVGSFRTVTVIGTSIPASLAGVPQMSVNSFTRPEWEAYTGLLAGPALTPMPRFGDYGVQHPELPDINPRFLRVFSQFRYSAGPRWLIARGQELRVAGYSHVPDLARLLVARPEYAGPAYSPGDEWLDHCARGATGNGSAEVWRRVGTSHHLVHVVRELAALFGTPQP